MTLASTDSGIVYPAEGMDGARIRAALKEHDRNLDLTQYADPHWNCWVYKVVYAVSPERQEVLFAWRDPNGRPLPLSSGLIDKVKLLDKNTSVAAPDPDVKNEELKEKREQDWADTREDLTKSYLRESKYTTILPRSRNLYLARARARARGKNV